MLLLLLLVNLLTSSEAIAVFMFRYPSSLFFLFMVLDLGLQLANRRCCWCCRQASYICILILLSLAIALTMFATMWEVFVYIDLPSSSLPKSFDLCVFEIEKSKLIATELDTPTTGYLLCPFNYHTPRQLNYISCSQKLSAFSITKKTFFI